jgi:pyruvate formate lyase activating enzyme
MAEVLIGNIVPNNLKQFEDRSSTVIYMGGCNFRCHYCYALRYLDPLLCKTMETQEVFGEVAEGGELVQGIVFDGGEPTKQHNQLMELCYFFKQAGLPIKINTNGSNAGIISELAARGLVDWVTLDIKAPLQNEHLYSRFTGISGKDLQEGLTNINRILKLRGAFTFKLEVKTTIVPHVMDKEHEVEEIVKTAATDADLFSIHQFTNEHGCLDPAYAATPMPTRDMIYKIAAQVKPLFKKYDRQKEVRIFTKESGMEKI